MKAFVITAQGISATVVDNHPIPAPTSSSEILVRVSHVGQNPIDWFRLYGGIPTITMPVGRVIGCDFAGTVVAHPAGSSLWKPGQRVAGFVMDGALDLTRGAFAEYLVSDATTVAAVPDNVTDEAAASLGVGFATAMMGLFLRLGLPEPPSALEGDDATAAEAAEGKEQPVVLINGASTSVSLYAVQPARLAGIRVVATASPRMHALVRELGADVVLDYANADWPAHAARAAGPALRQAFDCVSEVGTARATAAALAAAADVRGGDGAERGHLLCILPRSQAELEGGVSQKVRLETTVAFSVFGRPIQHLTYDNQGGPTPRDREFWERYLRKLTGWLESGEIRPNPIRVFGGLEDVLDGFREGMAGKVRGEKLVYRVAPASV